MVVFGKMHQGVRDFVRWVDEHRRSAGVTVSPPAASADLMELEQRLGMPLPDDFRQVLMRFNGASLPTGMLLRAGPGPGSVAAALGELAEHVGSKSVDVELPLPFHRTHEGSWLCFDRTAGPMPDTWPIVDHFEATSETRLVFRTFDGWCRSCVAEWRSEDFAKDFSLERYLRQGLRHVQAEPDISTAHATVAHALRRSGQPEEALQSYLRAAECVPPLVWCDWEALKLSALLGKVEEGLAAAQRLAVARPPYRWAQRETTPGRVADVVGRIAEQTEDRAPWLRVLDQLVPQAYDAAERAQAHAVRRAVASYETLPPTRYHGKASVVPRVDDMDAWWAAARTAYREGRLRDEDLILDSTLAPLLQDHDPVVLLKIRRDFQ